MTKTLWLTALATSTALAPVAHAQAPDSDLAKLTERFKKADTNGDGKLTKQEAKDGGMKRVARYFSRLDADKDGYVTFEQLKARLESRNK